jgi:GntR family transcriptional regulator
MQIWLSKGSDVPLREQLTAQIKLAILSQDLKPGQKLPSTREIARRFNIQTRSAPLTASLRNPDGWTCVREAEFTSEGSSPKIRLKPNSISTI